MFILSNIEGIHDTSNKGFTLIEVLVSATIIAILAVGGMVSYQNAQKKARDAKRISDLEQIGAALEMYRADVGVYPPPPASTALQPDYISVYPSGPKNDVYYYARPTNYTYNLQAYTEVSNNCSTTNSCGTSLSCNYCITNP